MKIRTGLGEEESERIARRRMIIAGMKEYEGKTEH